MRNPTHKGATGTSPVAEPVKWPEQRARFQKVTDEAFGAEPAPIARTLAHAIKLREDSRAKRIKMKRVAVARETTVEELREYLVLEKLAPIVRQQVLAMTTVTADELVSEEKLRFIARERNHVEQRKMYERLLVGQLRRTRVETRRSAAWEPRRPTPEGPGQTPVPEGPSTAAWRSGSPVAAQGHPAAGPARESPRSISCRASLRCCLRPYPEPTSVLSGLRGPRDPGVGTDHHEVGAPRVGSPLVFDHPTERALPNLHERRQGSVPARPIHHQRPAPALDQRVHPASLPSCLGAVLASVGTTP
jgi:hypothetical protein